MKFSYYPGCSLHSTAIEFSSSTEAVFRALNVELNEIEDWVCCGATSGHSLDNYLSHALPLYNLVLAESSGNKELLVPCAACYNSLRSAQYFINKNSDEAHEINDNVARAIGRPYQGNIKVRHIIDVLGDQEIKKVLSDNLKTDLAGIPFASYYGCLLTRPPKYAGFETNPEQPQIMDQLLTLIGARAVSWTHKNECCGASLAIPQPHVVEKLVEKIITAARRGGAAAIITACPLCQTNLDSRQKSEKDALPVFYITEVIALALGINVTSFLKKHLVNPLPVLQEQGLLVAS